MTAQIFNTVKTEEIKGITISGRRWFQRSGGNTYHSVEVSALVSVEVADRLGANQYSVREGDVWVDLAREGYEYGYDRMFEQTALSLLKMSVSDRPESWDTMGYIFQVAKELNVPYSENVYDVSRKKDL